MIFLEYHITINNISHDATDHDLLKINKYIVDCYINIYNTDGGKSNVKEY